jgi:hypothetical protein
LDLEAKHSLVINTLVREEESQVYPIDPVTVMLPVGRLFESRQIAVLALEGAKETSEAILIAAYVVEQGMWNSNRASPLSLLRERFHPKRPSLRQPQTQQTSGPIHLWIGRDYKLAFPEEIMRSKLLGASCT